MPFSQFETDAANGDLPDFSFIEPCLAIGHNDYHPAVERAMGHGVVIPGLDPPSSILGGDEFLSRDLQRVQGDAIPDGLQRLEHDPAHRLGRTGRNLRPCPAPVRAAPDPSAPVGEHGFAFDRSGYRVPAIIVSPWVAEGEVFNEEYRHTSLIATLREQWALGDPFTARDAAARTFSHVVTLDTPRDPQTWPDPKPRPVPQFIQDTVGLGQVLSTIGKDLLDGIRGYAAQHNLNIEGLPADPKADIPPEQVVNVLQAFVGGFFPLLTTTTTPSPAAPATA